MRQRPVVLYIACSLDGYIAGPNDSLDFLAVVEADQEDYGYADFVQGVDTVIMGRKTYEKVLSFGIGFPHREKTTYVLSRHKSGQDGHIQFYGGEVSTLVRQLKEQSGKTIFVDGGAETVFELMRLGLIDRYIISVIPVLLGNGTLLFKPGRKTQQLKLMRSMTFPSGLVQLWYDVKA